MEHRYLKVTWLEAIDDNYIGDDGLAVYISESELYDLTMQLMHIVREAIICLAFAISIAENNRNQKKDPTRKPSPYKLMAMKTNGNCNFILSKLFFIFNNQKCCGNFPPQHFFYY